MGSPVGLPRTSSPPDDDELGRRFDRGPMSVLLLILGFKLIGDAIAGLST